MENIEQVSILLVDDCLENLLAMKSLLAALHCHIVTATSGQAALRQAWEQRFALTLLDVQMPGMSGFEVAEIMQSYSQTRDIPVIFMTVLADTADKVKGFQYGAIDYLTKPIDPQEALSRITAHLRKQLCQDALRRQNGTLRQQEGDLRRMVRQQRSALVTDAVKIQKITLAFVNALENANTLHDTDTGAHLKRIGTYSAYLAAQLGCDPDFVQQLELYAPLHDVGKIGLPDAILKKPGQYTADEFKAMQAHVVLGANLLNCPELDDMARNIALYHHERWDGTGYVHHLAGTEIPLEARIVAIVDVYDALVSQRVYKKALTETDAERIIQAEAGQHFDPAITAVFLQHSQQIRAIRASFSQAQAPPLQPKRVPAKPVGGSAGAPQRHPAGAFLRHEPQGDVTVRSSAN